MTLPLLFLEFPTRRLWRCESLSAEKGLSASPLKGGKEDKESRKLLNKLVGVDDRGRGTSENSSLRGCFQRWTGVLWPWLGTVVPTVHSQGAFLTRDGNDGEMSWTVQESESQGMQSQVVSGRA